MSGGHDLALVDDDQGPVAVMLDLVNPAISGWRFRHGRRDFLLNEAERVRSGDRHMPLCNDLA